MLTMIIGLTCSIGHGQMLRPMFKPVETSMGHSHHGHDQHAMHHAAMESPVDHPAMPGMNSPFGDCFFAGSLPLIVLLLTVLGWLLTHRAIRHKAHQQVFYPTPVMHFPACNPRRLDPALLI